MAVRSRPLWVGQAAGNGVLVTAYTVPNDRTALVKYICLNNSNALARNVSIHVTTAIGSQNVIGVAVAGSSVGAPITTFIALEDGDTVDVLAGGAGITTSGFGALLLGDPA